jgi:hypothetical protein
LREKFRAGFSIQFNCSICCNDMQQARQWNTTKTRSHWPCSPSIVLHVYPIAWLKSITHA